MPFLPSLPRLLARLGVAFCFLGFGIWEITNPNLWTVYVPEHALIFGDPVRLVFIHGIVLTVTAFGVLSGFFARFWTGLATLILIDLCITIWVQEQFTDVFIRDVSLLLFTASLFTVEIFHPQKT